MDICPSYPELSMIPELAILILLHTPSLPRVASRLRRRVSPRLRPARTPPGKRLSCALQSMCQLWANEERNVHREYDGSDGLTVEKAHHSPAILIIVSSLSSSSGK